MRPRLKPERPLPLPHYYSPFTLSNARNTDADPPDAPSQSRWVPPPPLPPSGSSSAAAAAGQSSSSYHSGAAVPSYSNGSTGFGSSSYGQTGYAPIGSSALSGGGGGGGTGTGFETTMWRHDWEAAACYALGPFGAAFMLIFEVENDYVRFHAYQVRPPGLISLCPQPAD